MTKYTFMAISSELGSTDGAGDAIIAADAPGVAVVVTAGVATGTADVATGTVALPTLHAPIEVVNASSDARTSQDFRVEPFMFDAPSAVASVAGFVGDWAREVTCRSPRCNNPVTRCRAGLEL
jgi:hypothetical protein